ncbi:hypothetical protein pb186bvf_002585 [Paramecium bursaria]
MIKLECQGYVYLYHGGIKLEQIRKYIQEYLGYEFFNLIWHDQDGDDIKISRESDLQHLQKYSTGLRYIKIKIITTDDNLSPPTPTLNILPPQLSRYQTFGMQNTEQPQLCKEQDYIKEEDTIIPDKQNCILDMVEKRFYEIYDGLDETVKGYTMEELRMPQNIPMDHSISNFHMRRSEIKKEMLPEQFINCETQKIYCDYCSFQVTQFKVIDDQQICNICQEDPQLKIEKCTKCNCEIISHPSEQCIVCRGIHVNNPML